MIKLKLMTEDESIEILKSEIKAIKVTHTGVTEVITLFGVFSTLEKPDKIKALME